MADLPDASHVASNVDEKAIMDRKPKFLYDLVSFGSVFVAAESPLH